MFHPLVLLLKLADLALTIYTWLIIARALVSWVNPDPYNRIVIFLYRVTEPILAPIRRNLPWRWQGIDLSPVVALLAIILIQSYLIPALVEQARMPFMH